MKRLALSGLLAVLLAAVSATPASAAFGLHNLDVTFTEADGTPAMGAGTHPFDWKTVLDTNTVDEAGVEPEGAVKTLVIDQPAGLVVNPTAVPTCSAADFAIVGGDGNTNCPNSSAVGIVEAKGETGADFGALYNLVPSAGSAARLGFHVLGTAVTVEAGLRPEGQRNAFAVVTNIPQAEPFFGSRVTVWGSPFDKAHDSQRGKCLINKGSCPVSEAERPFVTMPTRCTAPLVTTFRANSWQNPGAFFEGAVGSHDDSKPPLPLGPTDCDKVPFDPDISAAPTSTAAESPSGLDFDLDIKTEGLLNSNVTAQSHLQKAVVTLPEGMTLNPSQAAGLGVCSETGFKSEEADSQPGEGCPQSSKVGTIEVTTPLLKETLDGTIYVAEPYKNPFNSLIAIYMVIRNRERGVVIRLAGKVEPDPRTGQLTTTVEDLPQQPFGHFHFHFHEGGRSPLVTPPACGNYEIRAVLTPSSGGPAITTSSPFKVTSGPNGSPCPGPLPPFDPGFQAGSLDSSAGSHSPFNLRVTRRDGDQNLTRLGATLPPGITAKIAGVSRCPAAAIALAKSKSGRAELASPSCPANSKVGVVLGGAGVGSQLTYVPGSVYLAGPFGNAPLSAVVVVPAVAGPFDVGTIVTHVGLAIDTRTARVTIDGSLSDPIPHILAGVPLKARDIRVSIDRPNFMLNPTSCDPFAVRAQLWGGGADLFSPADDSPVSRAARFQAVNCANLPFRPRLSLKLKGGIKRGQHPALTATLRPRPGDSNIARVSAALPHSEFLDQTHIRTICTRVQWAADACPAAAIYGRAEATTPLLEDPVRGHVYLRSSSNPLPDLVADLRGPPSLPIRFEVVGRIDSVDGGIRNIFDVAPDVPVSKVVLALPGGRKGLLVNSTNICRGSHRAKVVLNAHNGKRTTIRPALQPQCKAKGKKRGKARSRG